MDQPYTPSQDRTAFSIAGSDPSGGAGIQADLKTFTSIGVYGAAAITCLTAQNSLGVTAVQPVDPVFVKQQIDIVLADLPVTHIKTGMIGTPEIAAAISKALENFRGELICDPVLKASDGHSLFQDDNLNTFCSQVVARATVLTPNLPELELLAGKACKNRVDIQEATTALFERFPSLKAIAVKGGHYQEEDKLIHDLLFMRSDRQTPTVHTAEHPRIKTANTHGTGCTFASAFAAYHLITNDYLEAFHKAVSFMDRLVEKSSVLKLGQGNGPLGHYLVKDQCDKEN